MKKLLALFLICFLLSNAADAAKKGVATKTTTIATATATVTTTVAFNKPYGVTEGTYYLSINLIKEVNAKKNTHIYNVYVCIKEEGFERIPMTLIEEGYYVYKYEDWDDSPHKRIFCFKIGSKKKDTNGDIYIPDMLLKKRRTKELDIIANGYGSWNFFLLPDEVPDEKEEEEE